MYRTNSLEGRLILFATILASGMAILDATVVNIAIPVIQEQFSAPIFGMEWVVNAYALMLSSLILISGSLGDKFGRRRVFSYGIILFTISSFLCSISRSVDQLIVFRAIQGIGGAMMVPGSLSIINSSFDEAVRGKAIGLWSGLSAGIAALGPFLGGWLVQFFGWPSIFYINIPLGITALFLTVKFVPESKNLEAKGIDYFGALLVFAGLFGLTYGLITGQELGWGNSLVLFSIIIGLVFLTLFIFAEMRVKNPVLPFEIFKSDLVLGANLVTFFLYFALAGVIFFLVLNLQQVQHFDPIQAGLGLLPAILIITFLSGVGGSLADKTGPRAPMIFGPFIVSLGMFLLTLAGRNANYFTQFLPGLILFGVGMSFVIAPLTKSALSVDTRYSGAASGVNNAIARIAGLLAVAVLGAICLFIFSQKLTDNIRSSKLNSVERKQIIEQTNKFGAIQPSNTFSEPAKEETRKVVEDSFVYSFRWAMGINAVLAFVSAVISYFKIKPNQTHI